MYRAKAEAVSGTKVLAGGKWLTCIGNKKVRVGDYVYTDGRCVYGNNKISQQPMVITVPEEDEGIPILLFDDKNSEEYEDYDDGEYCFYNYDLRLKPLKQPEDMGVLGKESSSWVPYRFMINDYKRGVYVSRAVYEANYVTPNVYATNIDKRGNVYILVGRGNRLTIYKNEEEAATIDLSDLIERQINEASGSLPSGGIATSPIYSGYALRGRFAIIENENDWNALLFLHAHARQGIISEEYDVSYKRVVSELFGGPSETTLHRTRHTSGSKEFLSINAYLVNQDGYSLIARCTGSSCELDDEDYDVYDRHMGLVGDILVYSRTVHIEGIHAYSASTPSPDSDVKIPLQDGFYFTIDDYPNFPTNMFCYPLFMKISIYTKADKLVLTETFSTRSKITIAKVGARYLIGVRLCPSFGLEILDADTGYWESSITMTVDETQLSKNDRYNTYATKTPYVKAGLYLYDGKKLEKIADGDCKNERLRPMPKFKNWQKRIQDITFPNN